MVLFNYSTKELTAKIVYYGPGLCGKTTNLQFVFDSLPDEKKGRMLSLATQTDRTLYFDFLPVELGDIRGMKTRVQLYTVPGQVFYNETRRMVLKGVDGVVFVADSQQRMADANRESFQNLEANLEAHGLRLSDLPLVLQFNKRDLPDIQTIEEMNAALNAYNAPFYEAVATTGIGVHDTLKAISKLVLRTLSQKYESGAMGRNGDLPEMEPVGPPPTMAPAAETAAEDDWQSGDLESQLDHMDLDEIQGLLEEVDGISDDGEVSAAAGPPPAQGEPATEEAILSGSEPLASADEAGEESGLFDAPAAEPVADLSAEAPVFAPESDPQGPAWPGAEAESDPAPTGLAAGPATATPEEPVPADAAAAGDDGSVWLGLPPEEESHEIMGEGLSALDEDPAEDDSPSTAAEAPSRLTFESFLESEQSGEPEPASAWTEDGDDSPAPAAELSDAAAAPDAQAPALAPGVPEDLGNGHLRLPLRLELDGRKYTYILTLSLQPETTDRR